MDTTKKYLRDVIGEIAELEELDRLDIKVFKLTGVAGFNINLENKEFVVFKTLASAKNYAKRVFIKYVDDPEVMLYIERSGISIEEYAEEALYNMRDVESIISYDCEYLVTLTNGSLCYRII